MLRASRTRTSAIRVPCHSPRVYHRADIGWKQPHSAREPLHRFDNPPGFLVLFRREFVRERNLAGVQPFRPRGLARGEISIRG